jgi:hypothetical protein
MVYYLQRECNFDEAVSSEGVVRFDTELAISDEGDFVCRDDGTVDIMQAGTYVVLWYITAMTGKSTVGQGYELRKVDYSKSPIWESVAGSTNHIKVSQTSGFAILVISQSEIDDFGKATVAVFNTADAEAVLTNFTPRAGLLIYGSDFEELSDKFRDIDEEITEIADQADALEEFVRSSEVTELQTQSSDLSGLGVEVTKSGCVYNFRGIGSLNHQQGLLSGHTYRLLEAGQFTPMYTYQGDATVGTLWIETPSSDVYSLPLHFDTGIYFTANIDYPNLPVGTIFRFTQSLILAESRQKTEV